MTVSVEIKQTMTGKAARARALAVCLLSGAIALLIWPALTAPVVAPVLGGAVATVGSWRWIFIVNIPLGIIGFLLALKLIHGKAQPNPTPLDWRGLAALGTGIAAALIALEGIRVQGTNWAHVAIGIVASGLILGAPCMRRCRMRRFRTSHQNYMQDARSSRSDRDRSGDRDTSRRRRA